MAMPHEHVAERISCEDPYLIPYLRGWAGVGEPQPWGAAHGFALEVAKGYGLIKGENDSTITPFGAAVLSALEAQR